MDNFIISSLETHLFFARIMKEHSLFLEAGFQQPGEIFKKRCDHFRIKWEEFLEDIVNFSDGMIGPDILESDEIVTDFTKHAEKRTSFLTGVSINTAITDKEHHLRSGQKNHDNSVRFKVRKLNDRALRLLNGLIDLKQQILNNVNSCRLYTANYPLLIEHIMREAKLYRQIISELNQFGTIRSNDLLSMEKFWNRIMMEHALFIRGLLDPTEEELIETADDFADEYRELLELAKRQDCSVTDDLTKSAFEETIRYRDFKATGTQGILECNISSIIFPLLADHVLREANHYLRILSSCN